MNRNFRNALLSAAALATAAQAHISVASGNALANANTEVAFSVGHGCETLAGKLDTYSVTIDIPAGFTAVLPMNSDFAQFSVTKDVNGAVTSVTWAKPLGDVRAADEAFYKLVIRMKTPNTPFTTAYFAIHQTCKDGANPDVIADWVGTPSAPAPKPAASLNIIGATKLPGWNKYTSAVAISDLSVFFKDAAIVWKGTAAYSYNANTVAQIAATSGVTALADIQPDEEFWVRY